MRTGRRTAATGIWCWQRADAGHHANQLRQSLGSELTWVVGQRVKGMTLAQIGAGRAGTSTIHEQQAKAVERIREHVREHGLLREDLEPALMLVAA